MSGKIYDLTLSYGERDFKIHSLFSGCKIVGNPKFDDWFNNRFDAIFLEELRTRINPFKKTILYLPTHGELGSIKDLARPLKKLTEDYNILVKLHYFNITDEPELKKELKHEDIILFNDDTDLLPLLKIADVVLSDNSSAIFDAILADRPIVATDFLSKDFLDITHKKIKFYRRGRVTPTTYSGSIEQVIKREGLIVTIQKPGQLAYGIKCGLEDKPLYKNAREKIRKELFAFNDGKCGERAAKSIINLLNSKELPEKPAFYHALQVFENELEKRSLSEQKKDARLISKYENLLFKKISEEIEEKNEQKIVFSIIIIHNPTKIDFLPLTLRSLLEQTFPQQNYEIIIANGPPKEDVGEIIKEIPQIDGWIPAIKHAIRGSNDSGLGFIKRAINMAAGEIICFTESDCLAPSDWLLNFYIIYKKQPDVAGIGGYAIKKRDAYTIFDEYYYLELGKKLGTNREKGYLRKLFAIKNNLFHQNPAGALTNMSYKKEKIINLPINYQTISLTELAGMAIKNEILQKNNLLCFAPYRVTQLEKMTLKKFIQKSFEEGMAYYFFCLTNPNLKIHYQYNIFSIIKLPLINILDGYLKTSLSLAIFIGTLFRWLGKVYAMLLSFVLPSDNQQEKQRFFG